MNSLNLHRNRNTPLLGNGSSSEAQNYGARELSKEVNAVAARAVTYPPVDRGYLHATASTRGSSGEPEVRENAGSAFDAANAQLESEIQPLKGEAQRERSGAERHAKELSRKLEETPRYVEEPRKGVPWTPMNRAQVILLAFLSVLLLLVGLNTNAVVLLSSGVPGFESAIRAYLFCLIPVGLAVAVKAPASFLSKRGHLTLYTLIVWALGLFFGFWWAHLFASTFPALTQSAADIVNSLTQPGAAQEGDHPPVKLVFVSMSAEVFLAAGAWLTIQSIVEKHQGWTRVPSEAFLRVQQDLDEWCKRRNELARLAGSLDGKQRQIAEARCKYVSDTLGLYRAAVKLAANDGQLGDYLNG